MAVVVASPPATVFSTSRRTQTFLTAQLHNFIINGEVVMDDEFDINMFDLETALMPSIYSESPIDLNEMVAANDDEYPEFDNLYGMPA